MLKMFSKAIKILYRFNFFDLKSIFLEDILVKDLLY